MNSTREALEAALEATPDDPALHSAYADWLIEEGDPRGEYIRMQLALEDRSQPSEQIHRLMQASYQIRQQHEAEWLGPLNEFVNPSRQGRSVAEPVEPEVDVTFHRGWLDEIVIQTITPRLITAINSCPVNRLLRSIDCHRYDMSLDGIDLSSITQLHWHFPNLRSIKLGRSGEPWVEIGPDISPTIQGVEEFELWTITENLENLFAVQLPKMRRLTIGSGSQPWPLEVLARNDSLTQLEFVHLERDPQSYSTPDLAGSITGLSEFINSDHLSNLDDLFLSCPTFSDHDFAELAESPMIRRLRCLRLIRCNLTESTVNAIIDANLYQQFERLEIRGNAFSLRGPDLLWQDGILWSDNIETSRPVLRDGQSS